MALGWVGSLDAQGFRVTGRLVRGVSADSVVPLGGAWAVLHGVTSAGGSPVDSQRTDARGRYRFSVTQTDTSAIYLVSSAYHGITYFSEAVVLREAGDSVEMLVVYDTSSVEPSIRVTQRHVVVRVPDPGGGGRRTLELVSLGNLGARTRVSADGTRPTWQASLPLDIVQFQVGESDVSAGAVAKIGDTVAVTAPLPPGTKQVLYTYVVPSSVSELVLPIDQPTDRLLVLLEDTAAVSLSGDLIYRGVEIFEDAQFALFEGVDVAPGTRVAFEFSKGSGITVRQLWGVLVALVASVMLGALLLWWRRQSPQPVPVTAEALAQEIAALDMAFEADQDASPDATASYRDARAHLKSRLQDELAKPGHSP